MNTADPATAPNLAPLYAALARAIGRAGAVGKDAENSFHRYKYASAEGLIAEAREALAAEEVAVFSSSWQVVDRERENATALGYFADVLVVYTVAHSSGASMLCTASTPVISEKGRPEDKAVATALTYNLGYFLRGLLLLPRVDEDHDVDRRDDRGYEPQHSRQGQGNGHRQEQRQDHGQRQAENGNRAAPTGQGSKLPDPPQQEAAKPPAGKPFDMTAALLALSGARNLTELDKAGEGLKGAPEGAQRDTLRAAFRRRREELGGAPAIATDSAPVADKGWSDFCDDIAKIIKDDTATTWTEDDFGSEFAALVDRAATYKELSDKATPWTAAVNKRGGARVRALRATFKKLFDGRAAQFHEPAAAGAA